MELTELVEVMELSKQTDVVVAVTVVAIIIVKFDFSSFSSFLFFLSVSSECDVEGKCISELLPKSADRERKGSVTEDWDEQIEGTENTGECVDCDGDDDCDNDEEREIIPDWPRALYPLFSQGSKRRDICLDSTGRGKGKGIF